MILYILQFIQFVVFATMIIFVVKPSLLKINKSTSIKRVLVILIGFVLISFNAFMVDRLGLSSSKENTENDGLVTEAELINVLKQDSIEIALCDDLFQYKGETFINRLDSFVIAHQKVTDSIYQVAKNVGIIDTTSTFFANNTMLKALKQHDLALTNKELSIKSAYKDRLIAHINEEINPNKIEFLTERVKRPVRTRTGTTTAIETQTYAVIKCDNISILKSELEPYKEVLGYCGLYEIRLGRALPPSQAIKDIYTPKRYTDTFICFYNTQNKFINDAIYPRERRILK